MGYTILGTRNPFTVHRVLPVSRCAQERYPAMDIGAGCTASGTPTAQALGPTSGPAFPAGGRDSKTLPPAVSYLFFFNRLNSSAEYSMSSQRPGSRSRAYSTNEGSTCIMCPSLTWGTCSASACSIVSSWPPSVISRPHNLATRRLITPKSRNGRCAGGGPHPQCGQIIQAPTTTMR
jgi:hypothetical protein